jgi:hypothetical protein
MSLIAYLKNTKLHIFAFLGLAMLLTRGGHLLTSVSLPDASFALFFISGMLIKKPRWFISLFVFSVVIDLVTLSMNNNYRIPINLGYLGLLPSYGLMWFFGSRIANTKSVLSYIRFSILATLIAFLISTQTYNLLSGIFPGITIKESIQMGWEYLPQSLIYTMSYLMAYWCIQSSFKKQFVSQKATVL